MMVKRILAEPAAAAAAEMGAAMLPMDITIDIMDIRTLGGLVYVGVWGWGVRT